MYLHRSILLAGLVVSAAGGCSIPCDQVLGDADQRYADMGDELRRIKDPGGDGFDMTMVIPDALVDESFQRLVDDGTIDTRHQNTVKLELPGIDQQLRIKLVAKLNKASFTAVPGDPARVQVEARLRLRGESGGNELFDVDADVSGPVELITKNTGKQKSRALYVRMGDLEATELELEGKVLGQAFVAEIEGLLPSGGLGWLLDSVGLADDAERAIEDATRDHLEAVLQQLLDDHVGDVQVLDLGSMDLGAGDLELTGVGLRTGNGWIAVGLRTNLDTGRGALTLDEPFKPRRDRIQLRMSEAFVNRTIQLAYVEGMLPRAFDEQGQPDEGGMYRVEPLGIDLADPARVAVRVYRCEGPCGWAELSASVEAGVTGDQLDLGVGEVVVDRSRGAGKLIEPVLWLQQEVLGEPVELVQSLPSAFQPRIGGDELTMSVLDIDLRDDELAVELGYDLPPVRKPGKGAVKARSGSRKAKR